MSNVDHYAEAERALERADRIANADHWPAEGRGQDVANALGEANAHALLAIADRLGPS